MRWTPKEEELLACVWPAMGKHCAPMFPGRTAKGVELHANKLGIRKPDRRRFTTPKPPAPKPVKGIRIESPDDEPLVTRREDRRGIRSSYGFISTGPIPSVWDLAAAIGSQA